jgi:hypothetical protein
MKNTWQYRCKATEWHVWQCQLPCGLRTKKMSFHVKIMNSRSSKHESCWSTKVRVCFGDNICGSKNITCHWLKNIQLTKIIKRNIIIWEVLSLKWYPYKQALPMMLFAMLCEENFKKYMKSTKTLCEYGKMQSHGYFIRGSDRKDAFFRWNYSSTYPSPHSSPPPNTFHTTISTLNSYLIIYL